MAQTFEVKIKHERSWTQVPCVFLFLLFTDGQGREKRMIFVSDRKAPLTVPLRLNNILWAKIKAITQKNLLPSSLPQYWQNDLKTIRYIY